MSAEPSNKTPDPMDVALGAAVRIRRRTIGMSQEALAEQCGVSFQQIQKYEKGTNRVSASKLWDIARFFKVDISYFFEGLTAPRPGMAEDEAAPFEHDFPATRQTIEMSRLAPQLSVRQQKLILDMMREMAATSGGDKD